MNYDLAILVLKGGGLGLVAILIILEQRSMREALTDMRIMWAAWFTQQHTRERRRRRRDSSDQPPSLPQPQRLTPMRGVPVPPPLPSPSSSDEWSEDETTDIHELMRRERERVSKRGRGERVPRPGTHHDK